MTDLWNRKQLKADYLVKLINAYYYLLDNYDGWSAEQSAANLIRNCIRKLEPNFLG